MKLSLKKQKEYKKQIIDIFVENGYTIVSGKGTFRQGSCLVLQENKIVINGFLPIDLQIKFLVETAEQQKLIEYIPENIIKFGKSVS